MEKTNTKEKRSFSTLLNQAIHAQSSGILITLIALCIVFGTFSKAFLSLLNFNNILVQSSMTIITAVGMTFVISMGGIDISVGSVVALSGVVMGKAIEAGVPAIPAILIGLLTGAAAGSVNGFFAGRMKIPPFIITFAMEGIARALALIITQSIPIYGFPKAFRWFGTGWIGKVPATAVIAFSVMLLGYFVIERTSFGRNTLTIGGNPEAARLSGIKVNRHIMTVYALSGVTSALAAVILTGRVNTAEPIAGYYMEMDAIASAVIGGTSFSGGVAPVIGAFIGALIITILRNGLTLLNIQPYYQQLTVGIVIVAAVLVDLARKKGGINGLIRRKKETQPKPIK
jgi:ribose/xylose/arabinose/galactoside ABC-type transport system permease subunit